MLHFPKLVTKRFFPSHLEVGRVTNGCTNLLSHGLRLPIIGGLSCIVPLSRVRPSSNVSSSNSFLLREKIYIYPYRSDTTFSQN